eukprot:m.335816 g.335816  ORF g.335816 m.335816 type:complete len:581 (-) comp17684_c0_seq1:38-1780(-)
MMATTDPELDGDAITKAVQAMQLDDSEAKLHKKDVFINPSEEDAEILCDFLKSQLKENRGEVVIEIGTGDSSEDAGLSEKELDIAVENYKNLVEKIGAVTSLVRERSKANGKAADYLLRAAVADDDFMDVRVAVVGNVDAGKSTLLGVLTHGELDNGRGKSRLKLFRHKHEEESGRTSSVSHDILGFDSFGNVVNKPGHDKSLNWAQICNDAWKVLSFIDLAGHERYLKTTVFGLTGHAPDFAMLMVGSNAGVVGMAKEHLGLALALQVPVYVVVTKIDMCPPNVLQGTLKLLQKILKSPGCRKMPLLVNNKDDVTLASKNFVSERLCPIFQVSNVTGENLDLLKLFMNMLKPLTPVNHTDPPKFQIDETFSVPGVGTVVSGTALCGSVRVGDTLNMGPDSNGAFQPVIIKGIHRRRMPAQEVRGGQTASFALKKIKRSAIRKGMMLLHPSLPAISTWEFDGQITILHHPTTITPNYQAVVHVGSIRQTASIIQMKDQAQLRTGDKAECRFRFIRHPEYVTEGARIVFREGRTKAVGRILRKVPFEEEHSPGVIIGDRANKRRQQQQEPSTTAARLVARA